MEQITDLIKAAVARLYSLDNLNIVVSRPEPQFGDFTSNVAMQLAAKLGTNPRQIASEIAAEIEQETSFVKKVEIAGPGFINIWAQNSYYQTLIEHILDKNILYGHNLSNQGRTILTEYSDPNPLKPLHAGHLYTTLVGDSIARLLEATAAKVIRINYGGDVGPHVAKSMWAITNEIGEDLSKLDQILVNERPIWLGEKYVEGNNAYEDDEQAKAQILDINKQVYKIHERGDKESVFAQIYWKVRGWSYDYFGELYNQLGVVAFNKNIPESEVVKVGIDAVKAHIPQVYQQSDGAIVFKGEEYGLHTRVFINSQGLPTYEAKDVGLLLTKWSLYKFDESIVITANEQSQYMQVMLKSVEQFEPELARRSKHLAHGVVKLAGGVKMSSRKGNVFGALDILQAAKQANQEVTGKDDQSAVLAAVKYSFLKQRLGGDIIYDPKESVNVLGNSGPYLQYAYVRAVSITNKADVQNNQSVKYELDDSERLLVRKLDEFPDIVAQAALELMPHHICTYLYELAQAFNRFYEQNKVIGTDRQDLRLKIVLAYSQVLGNGLDLLGINKPQSM